MNIKQLVPGVCLVLLMTASWFQEVTVEAAEASEKTIKLVIDFSDGSERHFTAIKWKPETTVFDVMKMAEKHPRGIKIKYKGSGSTAFLTEIDGLKNTGAGKNWIYRVNNKKGETSIGVADLKSGDTVLWRFEPYR